MNFSTTITAAGPFYFVVNGATVRKASNPVKNCLIALFPDCLIKRHERRMTR